MPVDQRTLDDLAAFARAELHSGDIEPWAAVLRRCLTSGWLDTERAAWVVKLYNATDDLESAFNMFARWPTAEAWAAEAPHAGIDVAGFKCGTERRNLRGGLLAKHVDSYASALTGQHQYNWLRDAVPLKSTPAEGFWALMSYMQRSVWGTGRLAAFEWAEFAGKVLGMPVQPDHGALWESSGPRESLERIWNGGQRARSQTQLDLWASDTRDYLTRHEAPLQWWDLETVICDFNVMRKGRYYPGQHIAMIKAEIHGLPEPFRGELTEALNAVVPRPWSGLAPYVDKVLAREYARCGRIKTPFETPFGRVT